MATAQQARPETHGSRTQTIAQTPANEAGPSEPPAIPPAGVLKLRGGPSRKARVEWSDEVVDNEGMGRKKSKICCIYTKPRAFDESSSESGSSEDEHEHDHSGRPRGKDTADKGKGKAVRRKVDGSGAEVEEGPGGESESDGGAGDGRARPARRPNRRRHRHHHEHDHDHGPGCGGHAAKLNKYDAEPRRAVKPQPPPTT